VRGSVEMRKTFVVGRLTGSSSHILLLDPDEAESPLQLRLPLDSADAGTPCFQTRMPDPLTVH
jgi:hypothetical protein